MCVLNKRIKMKLKFYFYNFVCMYFSSDVQVVQM